MFKLTYVCRADLGRKSFLGVKKKVLSQMKIFQEHFNSQLVCVENGFIKVNYGQESYFLALNGLNKRKLFYEELNKLTSKSDIIYIRYSLSDPYFIRFLELARQKNKFVFLEFPTFPYIYEIKPANLKSVLVFILDRIYFKKLFNYCDYFVVYNRGSLSLKEKVIEVENGVDVKSVPLKRKRSSEELEKTLNLIGIGNISFWHGYDRIIKGMREYYLNKNSDIKVNFNIVGAGEELNRLKRMVQGYNLKEYINFYGPIEGEVLNKIFDNNDVAVGSLGLHRKKNENASSLKTREYCARGIPFIDSGYDPDFPEGIKFRLKVESNDESIEMMEIIKFMRSLSKVNYSEEMRNYAMNNLDWKVKMSPIINIMKNIK
jgi:hypothetical protein